MADTYRIASRGDTFFIQKRRWLFFWEKDRSLHFSNLQHACRWIFERSNQRRVVVFEATTNDIV